MRSRYAAGLAAVLITCGADGQTAVDLRTQSKSVDFTSAATTKPFKSGTVLPAACGVGEAFFMSNAPAGSNWYACTATNSWTLQSGVTTFSGDVTGAPGSTTVVKIEGRAVSATAPTNGQSLVWNSGSNSWVPQTGTVTPLSIATNGIAQGTEPALNFISGSGIVQSCVNNAGASRVDCTPAIDNTVALTIAAAQTGAPQYCQSSNGTTAYVCSLSAARGLAQYSKGMLIVLSADTTCSATCTVNIDALGAKSIKLNNGASDPNGAVVANTPYLMEYDGTVFRMANAYTVANWRGEFPAGCSITAFGAIGDGSHDDAPNINAALAACYDVYFPTPPVRYKTTLPLLMRSGSRLHGGSGAGNNAGAYIYVTGTGPAISATFAPEGNYVGGGSIAGTAAQTCNLTFLGGGGGTAVVALTSTNTIAANTALASFSGGVYNPAPTQATLSSGTATCSGTATVFIYGPGAGARNIVLDGLYLEDQLTGRTFGDGIYIDGTGDTAIFNITNTHTFVFENGLTAKALLSSYVSRSRFDNAIVNGINQSGASTSFTITGTYVDAPGQDCYSFQGLVYSSVNGTACDNPGRDAYHMVDTTNNSIAFNGAGTEQAGRYGFFVEGRGHAFNGTSCIVVDAAGNRCFYFDNVAMIVVNTGAERNGDYAYYYNGGSFATTFAGLPIVTIVGAGNYIAGTHGAVTVLPDNKCQSTCERV